MILSSSLRFVLVVALVSAAMTVLPPSPAEAATLKAGLVATRSTSDWTRPSPDPSGITWNPATKQLIISDSEVDEMPLYKGTNLFLSSLTGAQASFPGGTTLPWTKEPTGISLNPASGSLFVSDDDQDLIFHVRPGGDGRYGTGDDSRTSFSTAPIGNGDAEDLAVDMDITNNGHLLVVDGRDKEVYEYGPGPDGVFDGVAPGGDDTVGQYDVYRHGARDPEGIAYHPGRDTVLVLDGRTQKIFEMTRRGELLNVISITAAGAIKAAGIALAPASNGSGAQHLYIVDRGVDNNDVASENDGKFYEMSVALPPLTGGGDTGGGGGGTGSLDVKVARGTDDAEERADATVLSGALQMAVDRSRVQTVGLRFTGVTVPRGARITDAYVQFQADAVSTGTASLRVAGQAADNPATFTTASRNISSRATTAAAVGWNPPAWPTAGARGADQRTPNLAPVIQEIVARQGWASGNALVLTIGGSGTRVADSYNTDRAAPPTLHLEWTL
jgi:hypothetical protein